MYTILWRENHEDKWDRLETKDDVKILLDTLAENPDVCEQNIWIFGPKTDEFAIDYNRF